MVDYAGHLEAAEEVAASAIDAVLTEGGLRLFDRYLERKAFPFAAEWNNEALASRVQMCFVPCEDEDDLDDWGVEEEPLPCTIDAWARNHLEVRPPKMDATFVSTSSKEGDQHIRRGMRGARGSDAQGRKTILKASGVDTSDPRAFAIKEERPVDDEEEKFRQAKAAEDARRHDLEVKARLAEKNLQEERRRIEAMHEEMERRKHTFDLNGNIIWVDEVKPEKLPKMQELVPYGLKKDRRYPTAPDIIPDASRSNGSQNTKKKATRAPRRARADQKTQEKEEYPDSFSKLQHAQPPILETMNMVPGVCLEFEGKEKNGPDTMKPAGHMSRKDYVTLTESHMAIEPGMDMPSIDENKPAEIGVPTTTPAIGDPVVAVDAAGAHKPADGASGATPAAQQQQQQQQHQPHKAPAAGGGRQQSKNKNKEVEPAPGGEEEGALQQKAPVAPPPYQARAKTFDALGYAAVKPPRFHAPALGGPTNAKIVQPPLGATMGHGLIRSKSAKDDYYFPPQKPETPKLGKRSLSESSVLRDAGRAVLNQSGSQAGSLSPVSNVSPSHRSDVANKMREDISNFNDASRKGRIVADRNSVAYRNARSALFPHVPSSRQGGSRQGGSRQGGSRQGGSRQGGSRGGSQLGSRQGGSQLGSRQGASQAGSRYGGSQAGSRPADSRQGRMP